MKLFYQAVVALLTLSSSVYAQSSSITGAGATFPAPLYAKWASEYNKQFNIRVNYQSVGSGAGLRQIEAKTVDFGASDMPLTDDKLRESGLFQFPTVIGGVIPVVNIKGIEPGQMKLTGTLLGDIYLGKIRRWNDDAIKKLNPNLNLPDADISVLRRADGSGTTFIWTNYLSKVHPEWRAKIGEGTAVNWPTGIGGKGNEGVAAFVTKLPNSIGYVEYAYVKQNKMTYVQMQNAAGKWVNPTEDSFKAAAAGADWTKTYYQILTDGRDPAAWPISGATFILFHTKPSNTDQVKAALKFFDWAFSNGDRSADELDYVSLPASVKNKIREDWKKLGLF